MTDDGTPNLDDSETISITVAEVNVAPLLDPIGNQSADEQALLSFTATATDQDRPADSLTFSLDGAAIALGMSITSAGAFAWTPTELQGGASYDATITVTDDGTPNLDDSETISITVAEVNVAPLLDPIGNQSADEQALLSFTATATDQDRPADSLTFSLDGAAIALGMSITSAGAFAWTPTELQGGASYDATITVTDDGTPNLDDSETISITVAEVNVAGITVSPASGLTTTEAGGEATFTVRLDSEPADIVVISISSGDTTEGTVPATPLTFTAADWDVPQTATVTGVDDDVDDGDVTYTIVTAAATSDDPNYSGLDADDVSVTNVDDDEGVVPVQLGRVDFRRLESLDPSSQELWFRLETAHDGWLTVQSAGEWAADQLTLGLYDPAELGVPLAVSETSDATPRLDHNVGQGQGGQVYLLKVAGSASHVSLMLANLVHEVGSAVTVYGTTEADEFVFDAAASREITINGVAYHYEDTQVSTVDFNGGDGRDVAWLYDSAGDETLEAWPDRATLINGAGDGEQDYVVEVTGIDDLLSYATRGGNDSAIFHGSEGADKLKSYEDSVRLRAKDSNYTLRAKKFDTVVGDTGAGGKDLAVFNGTDGNETFTYDGAENTARVEAAGRDHSARGFGAVVARAGGGDADVAHFTDTEGDDVLYFKGHKTVLVSPQAKVTVRAFDEAHATAGESGFDVARLYDNIGDDHLEVSGDSVRLYRRNGIELDLIYQALGFERVKAYSTEGEDTKDIQAHTIDLLLNGWDE